MNKLNDDIKNIVGKLSNFNSGSDILLPVLAMIFSFLVAAVFILFMGESPIEAYEALFQGAFGSVSAIANTLSKSVPLMFTGLGIAFAMKAGLLNVGAEGQLYIGAFTSVVVALTFPTLPGYVLLPIVIIMGCIGGMIWGGVVGFLKAKRGVNEVIVTIMMNYIAIFFTSYLVNGPFKAQGMVPQTDIVPAGAMLTNLIPRTQLTVAIIIALVVIFLVYIFLNKTTFGYEIRAVGENSTAAEAGGINITKNIILTMAISGGIAALAGITEVLGKYGRFIDGFSPAYGFTGIAIAVLGKGHPIGTILTALLFGAMDAGSMRMNRVAGISSSMINVIQGLVILFIATPQIFRLIFSRRKVK